MILVTGGCGYIGSHIVDRLIGTGEEVVVFDDLSTGNPHSLAPQAHLFVGDICNLHDLQQVFARYQIDCVIHLAALIDAAASNALASRYQRVNVEGTRNLIQLAKEYQVKYYLFASSAAVYGMPATNSPIKETAPLNPISVYGQTKLAGERLFATSLSSSDRYGIFRFFNVGGVGGDNLPSPSSQSGSVMEHLFAVASGRQPAFVINGFDYPTSDGTPVRDFVHVSDLSSAFILAIKYFRSGGGSFTLNLGSGRPVTIKQLAEYFSELTGKNITTTLGPRAQSDIAYSLSDISQADRFLSWHPKYDLSVIIRSGLASYVKTTT